MASFHRPTARTSSISKTNSCCRPHRLPRASHRPIRTGPPLRAVEESDAKIGLNGAYHANLTLKAGFTTVRDVAPLVIPITIFALRAAVAEGKVPGPRHFVRRHYSLADRRPWSDLRLSPRRLRLCAIGVRYLRRRATIAAVPSAARCPSAPTPSSSSPPAACSPTSAPAIDQQFVDDEIRTIIETAHRLGRRVAAHAHGADGINAALRNGVDSIEHGSFLDDESIKLFFGKKGLPRADDHRRRHRARDGQIIARHDAGAGRKGFHGRGPRSKRR